MGFYEKLRAIAAQNNSWLCVGLDPDLEKIPPHLKERYGLEAVLEFNRQIIEATLDLICAYKPNIAFYEALGPSGLKFLKGTRDLIPKEIPVILDAKRGDIANTARKYAQAAFEIYDADAVTLNPYLGFDSIEPFTRYGDKGVFLLCRTSNPGAGDLQDLDCGGRPLYQVVAERAKYWRRESAAEIGVVVGATHPEELQIVRQIVGEKMLILVPGVGAQAADLERAVRAAMNSQGERAIINSSRSVLYASYGEDFAKAARQQAQRLREGINRIRASELRF